MTTLLDRIRNDRYAEDQVSHGGDPVTEPVYRRGWNNGSRHVESLFLQWMNEERLDVSLEELATAEGVRGQLEQDRLDRVRRFAAAAFDVSDEVAK